MRFDGQSAEGVFEDDVHADYWQAALAQLADVQTVPGAELIADAGSRLYHGLMAGDVQRLWIRAETLSGTGGVRLRLALHPPLVAALPWELLYDADRNQLYAADTRTPLVRTHTDARYLGRARSLRAQMPLRLLIAAADDPLGMLDFEQHLDQIVQTLGPLAPARLLLRTLTGRFDVLDLAAAAREHQADILHIITHGRPDGLLLWHNDEAALIPAGALRVALDKVTSLKFVFLSACLAGRESDRTPFASVGPQLLQSGIPAVAAMQFEINDDDAGRFAATLYEELLDGSCPGAIDVAVSYARSNLYALQPDRVSFGTPVLWLNADDSRIFTPDDFRRGMQSLDMVTRQDDAPSSAGLQSGDSADEYRRWLDALESTLPPLKFPVSWSFLAMDWQTGTQEFHDALHQLDASNNTPYQTSVQVERMRKLQDDLAKLANNIHEHAIGNRSDQNPA